MSTCCFQIYTLIQNKSYNTNLCIKVTKPVVWTNCEGLSPKPTSKKWMLDFKTEDKMETHVQPKEFYFVPLRPQAFFGLIATEKEHKLKSCTKNLASCVSQHLSETPTENLVGLSIWLGQKSNPNVHPSNHLNSHWFICVVSCSLLCWGVNIVVPNFSHTQDLKSNVADMNLKYITEGSLPITTQAIDTTSGKMGVSLLVGGSHWKPPFPSKVWKDGKFELVSFYKPCILPMKYLVWQNTVKCGTQFQQ